MKRTTSIMASQRCLLLALGLLLALACTLGSAPQVARAATTTISDKTSCENAGGSFTTAINECQFFSPFTVQAGDIVEINTTFRFDGGVTNNGTLNLNKFGITWSSVNNGTVNITGHLFRSRATFTNNGTININSSGYFEVLGETSVLNNKNTIHIGSGGTLSNFGTVNNEGSIFQACDGEIEGNPIQGNPVQNSPDCTPPVITPSISGTLGSNGWYTSDVNVSWSVTDAESAISSQMGCDSSTLNSDTSGTTLTCTASSAGGESSQSVIIKRDGSAPSLAPTVSPNPVLPNGSATVTSGAADALSGLASQSCGALDTSTVGIKSVSCTATDNAGNSASKTITYQVVYNFSGFFQPVDNLPVVNSVKAGSAIPVIFSLGGDQGLDIFAAGYPKSQPIACDGGAPSDEVETVAAGGSGLSYDQATQRYTYVWKTQKSWAGQCRLLIVKLTDGTEHVASFRFK